MSQCRFKQFGSTRCCRTFELGIANASRLRKLLNRHNGELSIMPRMCRLGVTTVCWLGRDGISGILCQYSTCLLEPTETALFISNRTHLECLRAYLIGVLGKIDSPRRQVQI